MNFRQDIDVFMIFNTSRICNGQAWVGSNPTCGWLFYISLSASIFHNSPTQDDRLGKVLCLKTHSSNEILSAL